MNVDPKAYQPCLTNPDRVYMEAVNSWNAEEIRLDEKRRQLVIAIQAVGSNDLDCPVGRWLM